MKQKIKKFFTDRGTLWFLAGLVVIAALSLGFFLPDAVEGNVLQQYDTMQGMANGQEAKAFTEATGETTRWTNSLFSGMPTFQIAPSYPSNSMFEWINTVYGLGLPSPASLLAMMMIGFFILLLAMKVRPPLALIGAVAYGFSSYFVILIGAGHIWKFITLAYAPATIAGIVLAYRGRYLGGAALAAVAAMMQIASNHVQMTYYFLFVVVGFVVAAAWKLFKEKKAKQFGLATGSLAVAALLAVLANLPSLYNTREYSKETIRGGHTELTVTGEESQSTGGLNRDYITQYSYQPSETWTLLIPNVKGGSSAKPAKGQMTPTSLGDMEEGKKLIQSGQLDEISSMMVPYYSQYFGDAEGTNGPVYVGAIIAVLFLLGCFVVKGPVKWVLLVLTLFSVVLSWGKHMMGPTDFMIDFIPMYSQFRTVESILVIAEFTMPLLAILALQKLLTEPTPWKTYGRTFSWCFGAVLAVCLIGIFFPGFFGPLVGDYDRQTEEMLSYALMNQGATAQQAAAYGLQNPSIYSAVETLHGELVSSDALRSFLFVAATALFLFFYMKGKVPAKYATAAVGLLVVFDLFAVNKRYLDHDSFVPKSEAAGGGIQMTAADRQILADTAMNYRVMDIPRFSSPAPSYYHKMIGGYHAAKLTRYQDLIDRHLSNFQTGESDSIDVNILNMLNAKYLVVDQSQAHLNDEAQGNAWMVDAVNYVDGADAEMAGLSTTDLRREAVADRRFEALLGKSLPKTPGDTIYETTYAPNRLTYKAKSARGGVAVFSEIYFPWGWKATVDGQPAEIGRVNYVLRALKLPAGEHTVEMVFDPESLHTTVSVARVSIILIYLMVIGAVVAYFAPRRKKDEPAEEN